MDFICKTCFSLKKIGILFFLFVDFLRGVMMIQVNGIFSLRKDSSSSFFSVFTYIKCDWKVHVKNQENKKKMFWTSKLSRTGNDINILV